MTDIPEGFVPIASLGVTTECKTCTYYEPYDDAKAQEEPCGACHYNPAVTEVDAEWWCSHYYPNTATSKELMTKLEEKVREVALALDSGKEEVIN